jgi:hypothetical protein
MICVMCHRTEDRSLGFFVDFVTALCDRCRQRRKSPDAHIEELENENKRLRDAIAKHRDQRADDRCWLDDLELYQALGDNQLADNSLPPREKFLANCERFYDCRAQAGNWPSYQELEQELAAAHARCEGLAERVARQSDQLSRIAERPTPLTNYEQEQFRNLLLWLDQEGFTASAALVRSLAERSPNTPPTSTGTTPPQKL